MTKNKKIGQGINALIAPKSVIDVKQADILMSRISPNPNQPRRIFEEKSLEQLSQSIEEKGQNGLEEERRLAYVGITRAKKKAIISFSMNRFYQGDWIDSMASRFIEELPEKHLEKNSFFDEEKEEVEDFEFNQDFELEEGTRSPGWIRYQKRIK